MNTLSRTWIDTKLSRKEREALVCWLLERSNNPSATLVRLGLEELFPERDLPSERSCGEWKAKNWNLILHLQSLREDSEAARLLAEDGNELDIANKKLVDGLLFERLRTLKDSGEEIDEGLHNLILSASRLTAQARANRESEAKIKLLEGRLAELDAREAEREANKQKLSQSLKKRGLSAEALREIDEKIKLI